jgi:L-ribulokinase
MAYAIGLDYGTNSVRCLIVDVGNGNELGSYVYEYKTGEVGIILDSSDHNLARQNPADYLEGTEVSVKEAMREAKKADKSFDADGIIGIGVDTTGSTPIPVDKNGTPLSMLDEFKDNANACAWLWKDHTGYAEAAQITELAAKEHPEYLAKCGGTYSSEWFFSKIFHCLRADPKVFDAAYSWVECSDYVPGVLTGTGKPDVVKRSRCAAGHKAMFSNQWGGLPAKDFLACRRKVFLRSWMLNSVSFTTGCIRRLTLSMWRRGSLPKNGRLSWGCPPALQWRWVLLTLT